MAAALTVAAIPAIAPPLAPKDIRVVKAAEVALTAQPSGVVNPVNHFDAPRADDVAGTTGCAGCRAPVAEFVVGQCHRRLDQHAGQLRRRPTSPS